MGVRGGAQPKASLDRGRGKGPAGGEKESVAIDDGVRNGRGGQRQHVADGHQATIPARGWQPVALAVVGGAEGGGSAWRAADGGSPQRQRSVTPAAAEMGDRRYVRHEDGGGSRFCSNGGRAAGGGGDAGSRRRRRWRRVSSRQQQPAAERRGAARAPAQSCHDGPSPLAASAGDKRSMDLSS